ncbi:WhiB transcriptional factor [Mycobacterium phage DyoEdafos]|uniref:WhiB family transcription factor n=1 Tax=Mycobacterium phage DyoEdafos TaxID=2599860 RepID=A0A5J6TNL7_9CAUD|nr:WhiB transcriptional factor [Mycobacterium phage DyoEdafos]QFG10312.1 WhiB family transcription factor [Mycobacterium phage DyoEdafos]
MRARSSGASRGPGSYGSRTRTPQIAGVNVGGVRHREIPELAIPDLPGALCKGIDDPEMFFPSQRKGGRKAAAEARKMCQRCPIQKRCLEWALDWDREHPDFYDRLEGIWGGTNEAERREILKEESNAA